MGAEKICAVVPDLISDPAAARHAFNNTSRGTAIAVIAIVIEDVILSDRRERRIPTRHGAEAQPKDFFQKSQSGKGANVFWNFG
jgi:hypothetical protein